MTARILIAEDSALLALDLGHALKTAGFEVIGPALSVEQALALIESPGCDAAVLDIDLRGSTSEQVAHRLLALAIPFVTLTGYAPWQQPSIFDGIPAFTKPVVLPELVSKLRWYLGLQAD
jgi:DNA-binding NarL/FixJ family response regulator